MSKLPGFLSIHMLTHRSLGVPSVSSPDRLSPIPVKTHTAAHFLTSYSILQLRRRVTLTPTELSRQYSAIVRFGLERMEREDESERDIWLMDSERATDSSPQDSILPSILPRQCTVT